MGNKAVLYLFLVIISLPMIFRDPVNGLFIFVTMNYIRPETLSYHALSGFRLPMVVSVITFIAFLLQGKNKLKYAGKLNIIFFLFVLTQLHSTLYAYAQNYSWYYNQVMMKIWVFTFLMTRLINTVKKFNWFIIINLIGIAFLSIWGFEQHFRGNIRLEQVGGGNFTDSNTLGAAMVQFLPIFVSLIFVKSGKMKIALILVSLITVGSIVFTESRAAFLAAAVSGMILIIRSKKNIQFMIIMCMILTTFYFVAVNVGGYLDRVSIDSMEREKYSERVALWKAAWRIGKMYPLRGVGQQNFQFHSARFITQELDAERVSFSRGDAHNTFLLTLAEGGFVSFFLYLIMIFVFFRDLSSLKRTFENNTEYMYLLTGLEAGMIGFLITNWFHSMPIMENFYWFLFLPSILKSIIMQHKFDAKTINEIQFNHKYDT